MDRGAWWGYSPWDLKESDMSETTEHACMLDLVVHPRLLSQSLPPSTAQALDGNPSSFLSTFSSWVSSPSLVDLSLISKLITPELGFFVFWFFLALPAVL